MIYFHNDYSEGCHQKVLEALTRTNLEQTPGYGEDHYCAEAADLIRKACKAPDMAVHFLVGGTQANLTVIDAALRPHQAAVSADLGHINSHETGAVEATGHKVMALPSVDGKITAEQVERMVEEHYASSSFEHTTQPKLVYISSPSELGTLYSLAELEALSAVCHARGLYLFLDGARLGYGLAAKDNDVTVEDLARLCDVFYIGGTKVGALFGEAVCITNPALKEDFRYLIKQHGGMLAKGRLLGVQFEEMLKDGLYMELSRHAIEQAMRLRDAIRALDIPTLVDSPTNQQFPILPNVVLPLLAEKYSYATIERVDAHHTAVRFCTSWATRPADVDRLIEDLGKLLG